MATQSQLAPTRPRRAELHPLITAEKHPERRIFVSPVYRNSPSVHTPDSAISLSSPSLMAVRQYYRDNDLTTALQQTPTVRKGSIPHHYPRRHSSISGPLAQRLNRVNVSSPLVEVATQPPLRRERFHSITEETRTQLLSGVEEHDRDKLANVVDWQRRMQLGSAVAAGAKVPFEETHRRLRHWGRAYLGNVGTADVLVNACQLRKPEPSPIVPETASPDVQPPTSKTATPEPRRSSSAVPIAYDEIIIRARITPSTASQDRLPFLIQRRFNVAQLRASIASTRAESPISPASQQKTSHAEAPAPAEKARSTSITVPSQETTLPQPGSRTSLPSGPSRQVLESLRSHQGHERRASGSMLTPINRRTMPIRKYLLIPHL